MKIKEAISLAVEGGWKAPYDYATFEATENYVYFYPKHGGRIDYAMGFVLLDPAFWQALGKSLGWKEGMGIYREPGHFELTEWWSQWHNFIDHLAEGGKAEEWFEKLK